MFTDMDDIFKSQNRILYLHGLESNVNYNKKEWMKSYGEVHFPVMRYADMNDSINYVLEMFKVNPPTHVAGSSMGGFVAYYYSLITNIPCLVFNPALPYRSIEQKVPDISHERKAPLYVFIGGLDTVIKAQDNINFLMSRISGNDIRIQIDYSVGHRIPVKKFCSVFSSFYTYFKHGL